MELNRYLIIKARKNRYGPGFECTGVRVTSNKPKIESNEKAIYLTMKLPDALFQMPELKAEIIVPENLVSRPVINADTIDTIQETLEMASGLKISFSVIEEEKQK